MNTPDSPSPHDHQRDTRNQNDKEREARRNSVREELIKWMCAPHEDPTHATEFHENETEQWVDRIFAVSDNGDSVTVKNVIAFEPIVHAQKGFPPYLAEIKGNVSAQRMGITSLDTLRHITIHGDLSLLGITDKTVPDDLLVDGHFIIIDKVPEELTKAIIAQYGKDKVHDLRPKER